MEQKKTNPLTPYSLTPLQKIIITSEILILVVSSPVVLESFTPMPIATYLHVQCITLWSLSSFFTRGMLVFFPIILVKILQYTNKWNQFHVYTFFIYIYTHTQYHWFYKLKYLPTNRIFSGFYLRIEFLRWCLIRD